MKNYHYYTIWWTTWKVECNCGWHAKGTTYEEAIALHAKHEAEQTIIDLDKEAPLIDLSKR